MWLRVTSWLSSNSLCFIFYFIFLFFSLDAHNHVDDYSDFFLFFLVFVCLFFVVCLFVRLPVCLLRLSLRKFLGRTTISSTLEITRRGRTGNLYPAGETSVLPNTQSTTRRPIAHAQPTPSLAFRHVVKQRLEFGPGAQASGPFWFPVAHRIH